jgi:flagellar basal body L-ring protein FlgH
MALQVDDMQVDEMHVYDMKPSMRPRGPRWMAPLLLGLGLALAMGGCTWWSDPVPETPQQRARAVRAKPPVNTSQNKYEGSLWRGAASWGNLLRDHRARYRGDLLTVNEMPKIIQVPEPVKDTSTVQQQNQQQQQQQQQEEEPKDAIDPVLAFLKLQEERRKEIEQEQNEILRSIDTIEVQVVKVLSNGNLVVRGVHPPIFRDQSRVKYVVSLEGIVQPSDVDNNNTIAAPKISRAEYRIRRLVKRTTPPVGDVARSLGRQREGELFDRLTNFITGPGTGSRNTQVSPK